jgi:hypothetical protein
MSMTLRPHSEGLSRTLPPRPPGGDAARGKEQEYASYLGSIGLGSLNALLSAARAIQGTERLISGDVRFESLIRIRIHCYAIKSSLIRSRKFPVIFGSQRRELGELARKHWGYLTSRRSCGVKFPVFFPVIGNSRRDEFAHDCIHRHNSFHPTEIFIYTT